MRHRAQVRKSNKAIAKRFAVYSAIGGACGLTFGATAAEAGIVYTPFSGVASQGNPLGIDLDDDGTDDFIFQLIVNGPNGAVPASSSNWAALYGAGSNAFVTTDPSPFNVGPSDGPQNLEQNDAISGLADNQFHAGRGAMQFAYTYFFSSLAFGPFGGGNPANPASGYVGLKFMSGGGDTVFGWAKVAIVGDVRNENFQLAEIHVDGFAYATLGVDIVAGQVPEPTSATLSALGLLALGAAGVAERRRRKKLAAN